MSHYRRAIIANPDVLGATPWYQVFHNDFWGTRLTDSGSHGSYRPLCVLSFRANHAIGGLRPFGFHLVNVILHCIATLLVVRLAHHLQSNTMGPLVAGLLFAAHPVHTEAIAGIVGRADLAACNLALLAVLAYIRHMEWREQANVRQWSALVVTILFSVTAVLCKETAITTLVICAVYDIIKGFTGYKDKVKFCFYLVVYIFI